MPFGMPSAPPPEPPAITPGLIVVIPRGISGCSLCTAQWRSSSPTAASSLTAFSIALTASPRPPACTER